MTRAERLAQREAQYAADHVLLREMLARALGPDVEHTIERAGGHCFRVTIAVDEPREFMPTWLHDVLAQMPTVRPVDDVVAVLRELDENGLRAAQALVAELTAARRTLAPLCFVGDDGQP